MNVILITDHLCTIIKFLELGDVYMMKCISLWFKTTIEQKSLCLSFDDEQKPLFSLRKGIHHCICHNIQSKSCMCCICVFSNRYILTVYLRNYKSFPKIITFKKSLENKDKFESTLNIIHKNI